MEVKEELNKEEEEEEEKEKEKEKQYHFVLVHGASHGAWCWYKLITLLETAGHVVTVMDLTASGINPGTIGDVKSARDYFRPMMECFMDSSIVHSGERVVLVGHSLGGVGVSLAIEEYPDSIAVGVFAAAMMPSPSFSCTQVFDEFFLKNPLESMLDTKFFLDQGPNNFPTSMIFGSGMLSMKLYQNCPPEDLKLAKLLIRQSKLLTEDMVKDIQFTDERFGSVARAYVVCKDDKLVSEDFQRLLIERTPVNEVEEIEGSDHMVMLSKPVELFNYLLTVARKYV